MILLKNPFEVQFSAACSQKRFVKGDMEEMKGIKGTGMDLTGWPVAQGNQISGWATTSQNLGAWLANKIFRYFLGHNYSKLTLNGRFSIQTN